MGFKVIVDFDKCESNALCMGVAPEVFEVRDDDFLYVLQEEPPDSLRSQCEEAARICPKQAITIQHVSASQRSEPRGRHPRGGADTAAEGAFPPGLHDAAEPKAEQ